MTYRIVAISVILSDLQDQPRIAGLLECDFSYNYAAFDKNSTVKGGKVSRGPSAIVELLVEICERTVRQTR